MGPGGDSHVQDAAYARPAPDVGEIGTRARTQVLAGIRLEGEDVDGRGLVESAWPGQESDVVDRAGATETERLVDPGVGDVLLRQRLRGEIVRIDARGTPIAQERRNLRMLADDLAFAEFANQDVVQDRSGAAALDLAGDHALGIGQSSEPELSAFLGESPDAGFIDLGLSGRASAVAVDRRIVDANAVEAFVGHRRSEQGVVGENRVGNGWGTRMRRERHGGDHAKDARAGVGKHVGLRLAIPEFHGHGNPPSEPSLSGITQSGARSGQVAP